MTKRPIIPLRRQIPSEGEFHYWKSSGKSIPLTVREEHTIQFYDKMSLQSIGVTPERQFWKDQMDDFQRYLKGGSVLDVGCGAGRDLEELAGRGYQCVGIDASNGMLLHAYLNNPYCVVYNMSMYDLGFPDGYFDGFWSSASLHHIQKSRVDLVLGEMRRVTADGGIGFISVREGRGELLKKFLKLL